MKTKQIQGYIRVSPYDERDHQYEKQILDFAKEKGWEDKIEISEEQELVFIGWKNRILSDIVEMLTAGDVLIVPALHMLEYAVFPAYRLLKLLNNKGVNVYSLNENIALLSGKPNMFDFFEVFELITKFEEANRGIKQLEIKHKAKEKGIKLGRPRGSGKSKLDEHKEEIIKMHVGGVKQKYIAERFKVSPATVWHYMKKHGIDQLEMDFN